MVYEAHLKIDNVTLASFIPHYWSESDSMKKVEKQNNPN